MYVVEIREIEGKEWKEIKEMKRTFVTWAETEKEDTLKTINVRLGVKSLKINACLEIREIKGKAWRESEELEWNLGKRPATRSRKVVGMGAWDVESLENMYDGRSEALRGETKGKLRSRNEPETKSFEIVGMETLGGTS